MEEDWSWSVVKVTRSSARKKCDRTTPPLTHQHKRRSQKKMTTTLKDTKKKPPRKTTKARTVIAPPTAVTNDRSGGAEIGADDEEEGMPQGVAARLRELNLDDTRKVHMLPMPSVIRCPLPRVIKVGSMCAGMCTEHFACELIGNYEFALEFWAEKNPVCRKFLNANTCARVTFKDVCHPFFGQTAPYVDILFAGWPCQPFSAMGLNAGTDDKRSYVLWQILRYLMKHLPRIAILENVKGLTQKKHLKFLIFFLECLRDIEDPSTGAPAYSVFVRCLNSLDYGVPQSRERIWIVLIKRCGRNAVNFQWPASCPRVGLDSIFDSESSISKMSSYEDYPLPETKVAKRNLLTTLLKVHKLAGIENREPESYPVIYDADSTECGFKVDLAPCLTKARGESRSFRSLQHDKRLSASECLRLQGHDPDRYLINISPNQLCGLVGNGFTLTVCHAVTKAALAAAEA